MLQKAIRIIQARLSFYPRSHLLPARPLWRTGCLSTTYSFHQLLGDIGNEKILNLLILMFSLRNIPDARLGPGAAVLKMIDKVPNLRFSVVRRN